MAKADKTEVRRKTIDIAHDQSNEKPTASITQRVKNNTYGICTAFNALTRWIPDNVNPSLIPKTVPDGNTGGILNLWWSGMAQKVIDLLALERILPLFGNRIRLNIVTGDLYAAIAFASSAIAASNAS